MLYYYIAIVLITIVYIIIILSFLYGWNRIQIFKKGYNSPFDVYISVVIPFCNEETNIPPLLTSISNQSLENNLFELILVDDHSSDNSYAVANKITQSNPNFKLTKLSKNIGKKHALQKGIEKAKGKLIISSDADCTHHKDWLKTILSYYKQYKPKMIIGPVIMHSKNTFENIQAIDFFSLMASGAGASGISKAIMCNGANLIFEKSLFNEFDNAHNTNLASGDDVFFLLQVKKKYPNQIAFLKSKKACVYTQAEQTLNKYIAQRKRWASKSIYYKDKDIIITAIFVFLINISLTLSLIFSAFSTVFFVLFILGFTIKSIIDFIFLLQAGKYFKQQKLLKYFLPAQLFNIILLPYIAISGIFSSVKWKGRKVK